MRYPRVILAGTNSGVGKTTLAMGLISALKKRGLKVQSFKAGPDYIDPSYHALISGEACRNLDTWMLPRPAVLELFERKAKDSDISVIEGVMGLYDGLRDTEKGSTAHLAKITRSPIILIVDARSMSRSAGAIVLGYKEFDKELDLRGVILNNIGSPSHYNSAKRSIEKKRVLPVLGFLPRDKNLILEERHLGLIPTGEKTPLDSFTKKLSYLVEENIDVDKIIGISRKARALPQFRKRIFVDKFTRNKVSIAIAKDKAFNFYYQDNLDILEEAGANLIEFSPLRDKILPRGADGLYIGGGFPELFAKKLSENTALKSDIYKKAKSGMPIYAECGGLMYLVKELLDFRNKKFPMVGVFDESVKMSHGLRTFGYVNVRVRKNNILSDRGATCKAHIFHWSHIDDTCKKKTLKAYTLKKYGERSFADGLIKWNVLASYAHLHFGSRPRFAKKFIKSCEIFKKSF